MPAQYTHRLRREDQAQSRLRPGGYQVKAHCGAWTMQADGQEKIKPVNCPKCLGRK